MISREGGWISKSYSVQGVMVGISLILVEVFDIQFVQEWMKCTLGRVTGRGGIFSIP